MKPRFFSAPSEFGDWLEKHHATETELLVGFHKLKTGKPTLTWPQSVDEALCYGWIDGVRRSLGETSYTIRFTPRRPTSHWSSVNIKRVAELIAEKRMRPAGLAAWGRRTEKNSARASFEQKHPIELPAPMLAKLRANGDAWKFLETVAPSYRKAAFHWVVSAVKEETREKRLGVLLECSATGLRIPSLRPLKK